MKTITNILALIIGIYGIIVCSINTIVVHILRLPLYPLIYTNKFKLKESEKWKIVDKLLTICDKIDNL